MTGRRASTLIGLGVAVALTGLVHARAARAYSFVEEVPDDACVRTVALDPGDTSVAAGYQISDS